MINQLLLLAALLLSAPLYPTSEGTFVRGVNSRSSTLTLPTLKFLHGRPGDALGSNLVFGTGVTGTLVQFDGGGATEFGPSLRDIKVDGQHTGMLSSTTPVADGVVINGNSCDVSDVLVTRVCGWGFVTNGMSHVVRHVRLWEGLGGFKLNAADSKYFGLYTDFGTQLYGLWITGTGTHVIDCHISGGNGGAAIKIDAPSRLVAAYGDSSDIGTWITGGGNNTIIQGLEASQGTCLTHCLKLDSSGCEITGIDFVVRFGAVGAEITTGQTNNVIVGQFVSPNTGTPTNAATHVIVRGKESRVIVRGGWNTTCASTMVKVPEAITGCTIEISGHGNGGKLLDLTGSGLDSTNGRGNTFIIRWRNGDTATRVIYPNGTTTPQSLPGTTLIIDGVWIITPQRSRPTMQSPLTTPYSVAA